jgi:hypothetical protein
MATIHPPANGAGYNAEEQAANTWPIFKHPDPLTPAQLDELHAKAPAPTRTSPIDGRSHSEKNAERSAKIAAETEARRQEKLAELAAAKKI